MELHEQLNSDVVNYVIVNFLCVDRSPEEEEVDGTKSYMGDRCYDALRTIYMLRSACRYFYETIETNQSLWYALLQHTRRSMTPRDERKIPLMMPSSVDTIKEFVRLDQREYRLRMILASLVDMNGYGSYILGSHRHAFDHSRVVLQKYIRPKSFLAMSSDERIEKRDYDCRLLVYKRTVRRMNQLCGGIRKNRHKDRIDRFILEHMVRSPLKMKADNF